jgi:crossover junction endodeoxyribonuclease RuvC
VRILGLDPGSLHTGFGVLERRPGGLAALAVGRISSPRRQALPERLAHLSREARDLWARWQPDLVVVEAPFHGVNARSLIVLAEARGALLAAAALSGAAVREFSPAEVKAAVAGHGRAAKDQVARMVRLLLGLDGAALPSDATDALAVAICCANRLAIDALGGRGAGPARSRK